MKKVFQILLLSTFFMVSCNETYNLNYNNLSMYPLLHEMHGLQTVTDCRVSVTTAQKFNVEAYDNFAKSIWQSQYEESDYKPDGNNGSLHAEIKRGTIAVYDSSNTQILEVSVMSNIIKSFKLYKNGEILFEHSGDMGCEWFDGMPRYTFLGGYQKIYNEGNLMAERISDYTKGCQSYVITTNEYYPSGKLFTSEKCSYECTDEEANNYEQQEVLSRTFFNEDGTIMTPAERLFIGNPKYLVLKSDLDSYDGTNYFVLFPSDYDRTKGKGISVYSNNNLRRVSVVHRFDFDLNESTISFSNFYGYKYGGLVRADFARTVYQIEEKSNREIQMYGNHYFWRRSGQPCEITMRVYDGKISPTIESHFWKTVNAAPSPWY